MPHPAPPPYDLTELRGDLNHLIQPLIGALRIENRDHPDDTTAHRIDRLRLALALVDAAAGTPPPQDYDIRAARRRHGCGAFTHDHAEGPAR